MRTNRCFVIPALCSLAMLWSAGPVSAEKNTNINVFAEVFGTYDDNILYDSEDELEDFIMTALVGLGFRHDGKTHNFRFQGSIEQNIFIENDDFTNTAQYLDLEFKKELSALDSFRISNNFEHAEIPDTFEEALGREAGRYEFYNNEFEAEYFRQINIKHGYHISYGNDVYTAERSDIPDSVEHIFGTGWDYHADPANTYSANYQFKYADYDTGESAQTHTPFGRWVHLFTKRTRLQADAGASFIDSFGDENHVRPYVLLEFVNDVAADTRIILRGLRESQPSRFRSDIFDLWRVSAELYKQLNRRLSARLRGFYGQGEYLASNIEDKLAGVGVNMEYAVRENVQVFVDFLTQTNDSNEDSRDYDKNQVSLGIRIEF